MLRKGYWCEEEKGSGFTLNGRDICLRTRNDLTDRYRIWLYGVCRTLAEWKTQKKEKIVKKKKNPKQFQSWSFKSHSKSCFVLLEQTSSRLVISAHNLKGSHQSGTLQTVVTLEMFQVSLCEPVSFQPIFQMALDFILLGKLLSPLLHPYFLPQKKEEWIPTFWVLENLDERRTERRKIKFLK